VKPEAQAAEGSLDAPAQKSPYDAKIYFTKLPVKCTIDIFTVNGDLIRTIQHDDQSSTDPNSESVDYFDLLSKNNERVQSQTLIAVIKTAQGAQTVKEFSVIVGGFRIITN